MQSVSMRKITISLPQDLVEFADRVAHQADISRSQVISQALVESQVRNEKRLAEEGYRFFARESAEFAQASGQLVAEAMAIYETGEGDDASEAW